MLLQPTAGHIDLLRHGKTERDNIFRGQIDDPLTDKGWAQMAQAVDDHRWQVILSSPLSRCQNFAQDLAENCKATFEIDDRFAEYNFGDWDGETYDKIIAQDEQLVHDFFNDPFHVTPPNAERFLDFHQRVIDAWQSAIARYSDQSILIVAHGGVIMSVLADVLGVERMHGKVDVAYASRTRIRIGTDGMSNKLIYHGNHI